MKGTHYRNEFVYNALAFLKLGREYDLRYKIAASYIGSAGSILDVCSGPGRLRRFLPKSCSYTAIDASPEFHSHLQRKGVEAIAWDLHKGWPLFVREADVIVMVISLSQFRTTSADDLLESFKKSSKRVVIIEDVLFRSRPPGSLIQRVINYLCRTDYYVPVDSWYTQLEFKQLMKAHGYQCEVVSRRYVAGLYGFPQEAEPVKGLVL